jgi:hypothetical protein
MKKKYNDFDGSKFPVGSPEYTKWLDSLEPVYKELMLTELRERARQVQKANHADQ